MLVIYKPSLEEVNVEATARLLEGQGSFASTIKRFKMESP